MFTVKGLLNFIVKPQEMRQLVNTSLGSSKGEKKVGVETAILIFSGNGKLSFIVKGSLGLEFSVKFAKIRSTRSSINVTSPAESSTSRGRTKRFDLNRF